MTRFLLAGAAALALSELAAARAQYFGGPVYSSGYSYSYRSKFGFSVGGPGFRFGAVGGGFVTRSVVVGPPVFVAPGPVVPLGFAGPAFGPGFGSGFGFGPPVVAVAVPVPVPVPVFIGRPELEPPPPPAPRGDELFPKVGRPGDFVVIAPRRDGGVDRPRIPDPPRPLVPMVDSAKGAVRVEVAETDPLKEAARQIKLGRAAFAEGDYGRAAEHFERATAADPADATTYFLHGQAKFAAGQYREATARIRDGLARDPKWPRSPFRADELYAGKAEAFAGHLRELKKAVADNPGVVTLEFLLGYQLWFSGERAEADKLFRAAEKRLPDPGPLALFKLP